MERRLITVWMAPVADGESAAEGRTSDATPQAPAGGEGTPTWIGPYRVVRLLGTGGMGRVYEAEQESPVRRRLAVKLIRRGQDTRRVVARFHAERQALAVMDHPSIARVFDAGAADNGQPYFAMELVPGESITDYCRRQELSLDACLELLIQVCEAVQHAHRKGVIHRDLKPSNILVVESDGGALPKIIDFGIAKATEQPLTEGSMATRMGEVIGTPEYMSPEQASLGGVDVDTRSDVYALGLVLFEILVGDLPLPRESSESMNLLELCRRIREDATPRPSLLLTRSRHPETRSTRAGTASWARQIRGDLDRVVLKALAKDREQRYDSAATLAADLRRVLRHEPVLATPPSWSYRASKFVRRHAVAVTAAVAVALALIVGLSLATSGLLRARAAEQHARQSLASAERTSDFLVDLFRGADPRSNPGLELTARQLLERGREQLDELGEEPLVEARAAETLGEVYWSLGAYDEAQPLLARAIHLRESESAAKDPVRLAVTLDRLGALHRSRAELPEAEAAHRRALDLLEQALPVADSKIGGVLNNLGIVLRRAGKLDEAAIILERSREITEQNVESPSEKIGGVLNNLSRIYHVQRRYPEALVAAERALAEFEPILPEHHPSRAILHSNLSLTHRMLGHLGTAIDHAERAVATDRIALPADHPRLADSLHSLGNSLVDAGRFDEASALFDESVAIHEKKFGHDGFRSLPARASRGRLALVRGSFAEARQILVEAIAALETHDQQPAMPRYRVSWLPLLTVARRLEGDFEGARTTAQQALAASDDTADRAQVELDLAVIALAAGDTDGARGHYRAAVELSGCTDTEPCSLDRATALTLRASYWALSGDRQQAARMLQFAVEHAESSAWLLKSPDLVSLHDEPGWPPRQLVEKLAKASPSE